MLHYLILLGILWDPLGATVFPRRACVPGKEDIYGFSATLLDQSEVVNFDRYKRKVLLIYNTATYCGLGPPSYTQMNTLAEVFEGQDFEVLLFPCSNFNGEEPGANYDEILNAVKHVRPGGGFQPKATYFEKVDVSGDNEHPIYTFLKSHCPVIDTSFRSYGLFYNPKKVNDVHWNYEKFLIGRDGKPHVRYHSSTSDASALISDITNLLNQPLPSKF